MKILLKSGLFLSLVLTTLFITSCYPAHSGSGGNGGGGGGATQSYTVGGTVSGLTGTGLVLLDNGADNLTIIANGSFTFKTPIASGGTFNVSVFTQPSGQTCSVTGATGTVSGNVSSVQVACAASGTPGNYTIGGQVTGLVGSGLVLQDNGADNLAIGANGAFTFAATVTSAYNVTIKTQPSNPTQTCTVTNGTGTAAGNVTDVQVACGNVFTVGGSITGLIGSGMVLQDNDGDNFKVTAAGNSTFTFATPLPTGATYSVTILTQPSNPTQTCFVANNTGTINGNITNLQITCSQPAYSIGGSVVGLITGPGDTLELLLNAGDNLFVSGDTSFTFSTPVTNGGIYDVGVFLEPTSNQGYACNLFYYTGFATGNVSDVVVDCQHNDWDFASYLFPSTEASNNYATITTPLFPPGVVPAPTNIGTPGGRDFAAAWTDNIGRKWLFGGQGYPYPSPYGNQVPGLLNDLWVYDGTWIPANLPTAVNTAGNWVVDPTPMEAVGAKGVYGTLNTATAGATPGARWGSSTWTDASGNLWLFGGQGADGLGSYGVLNDVWEWIPGTPPSPNPIGFPNNAGTFTGQWIWRGGSNFANANGTYGSLGSGSTSNIPGGRWAAATFTDTTGNVWLYGGQGFDSAGNIGLLNDLWEYNIASGQWTWVSGSNTVAPNGINGVYGAVGTPSATNIPGGRQNATLWLDSTGVVWLFGGFGFDSTGTGAPEGAILNDLWKFTGGQWTWVSGSNLADHNGVYGTQTMPAATNFPGARWGAMGWTDASNNLWFFGGWGYGSVTTDPVGFLDDIWEYQHSTGQWIWWKGSLGVNQASQYDPSTDGIPFVKDQAGARRGAAVWQPNASDARVWVFGGEGYDFATGNPPGYLNDIWNYLPFP